MTSPNVYAVEKMKMTTDIPPQVLTPDAVQTRLGTLRFFDGFPDDATVEKVFDNLDFQRGVQAYLTTLPAALGCALREGLRSAGMRDNQTVGITETMMDAKTLVFMLNCDSIYCFMWLDLRAGPLVIEAPPHVLGFVNDFWCSYVGDVGNAGLTGGKGANISCCLPASAARCPSVTFFEQVNQVVQEEPNSAVNADTLGLLAAIGIVKGQPFAPDARMRAILTDAVAVGNATARAVLLRSRIKESYYHPDSAWFTPFVGGS